MPKSPNDLKKLSRFMEYALGRRPDEFGLSPDDQGFVKIKTLLQALVGDPEWRHIREGHIQTLYVTERPSPIEIQNDRVRACHRDRLPVPTDPAALPPLLYTAIRRRSYPVALDKGIRPAGAPHIQLSTDIALIERIGRRTDNNPIILTVQVAASRVAGTHYLQYGEALYLADFIAAGTFSGPPLPKEKPIAAQPSSTPKEPVKPGSFFPDLATVERKGAPQARPRRNEADWKKDRRRARKDKARQGY
jgi:putative RNA 2'-phosphotransferase